MAGAPGKGFSSEFGGCFFLDQKLAKSSFQPYACDSQELAQLCQCSSAELLFAWNLGEFNLRSSRSARDRCASVGSYVLVYLETGNVWTREAAPLAAGHQTVLGSAVTGVSTQPVKKTVKVELNRTNSGILAAAGQDRIPLHSSVDMAGKESVIVSDDLAYSAKCQECPMFSQGGVLSTTNGQQSLMVG
ncbi:hypothetical protein TURU_086588 [Turdus rufiventris]|nr:hypothetical protein TURU_086588 [Turdus rufiventris]